MSYDSDFKEYEDKTGLTWWDLNDLHDLKIELQFETFEELADHVLSSQEAWSKLTVQRCQAIKMGLE